MQLVSGQKVVLSQLLNTHQSFILKLEFNASFPIDFSCFAIGLNDQLYHDDYMTFYNQPRSPKGEVSYVFEQGQHQFQFNLAQVDLNQLRRFVICATVDAEQMTMRDIQQGTVELCDLNGQILAVYPLNVSQFSQEKAVMLTEIYFKSETWRWAAIGQGFNGGLKALVEHFGGEVAEEDAPTHTSPRPSISQPNSSSEQLSVAPMIDLKKRLVLDKIEKNAPRLMDLTKKSLISLEKNQLLEVKARVALVLDYSGSMDQQYKNGDVQKVLDRIMPLALNFDDDGSFECWAFAEKSVRLSDVHLHNLNRYIETEAGGFKKWKAGARYNNEPAVLESVLNYFTQQNTSQLPVYVVFISDGGVSETKKIKQILKAASAQPIFWQFIGIGGRNYGVLEQLDNMEGRVVDNCNFFAMQNINSLPESELYDLLLKEFPVWLKEAKTKNILSV